MTNAAHHLVVRDLHAGVPGRRVLNGIDIEVASGEIHAVMGPNGSGKSTLAHVLMGKPGYEVEGGSVTLDGVELLDLPTWRRARLGLFLAPQNPTEVPGVSLDRVLRAAEATEAPEAVDAAAARDVDATTRARAEAPRVGLERSFLDRPVNVDLSGGERKRSETLQLAVLRPVFAVLDELDSGIDVDGLRSLAARITEAVDQTGLGVLAITHYRRLLSELRPDRVHVLVRGRIVASGGPELATELERTGYAAYDTSATPSTPADS